VWHSFELRSSFGLLVRSLSPSPLIPGRAGDEFGLAAAPNLNRLKRKELIISAEEVAKMDAERLKHALGE